MLVDESSTLGNRDFLALLRASEAIGFKLVNVGDSDRHTAVAAGGAWRHLLQGHRDDVAELRYVRRQKGQQMPDVRQALAHWRDGDIDTAISLLDRNDRVVVAHSRDALLSQVVEDWYADHVRRRQNPDLASSSIITERHRDRCDLNTLAVGHLVPEPRTVGRGP